MGIHQPHPRLRRGLSGAAKSALALGLLGPLPSCGDAANAGGSDSTTSHEGSTGFTTSTTSPSDSTEIGPSSTTGDTTEETTGSRPDIARLEDGELRPGGDTTTETLGVGAFVQEAANLTLERRAQFEAGLQFFQLTWQPAPGSSELDGLGPTYNATSCLSCHVRNGRGHPPETEDPMSPGVLIRLRSSDGTADPRYGDQLQTFAIAGAVLEGALEVRREFARRVDLADTTVALTQLVYSLTELSLGPLDSQTKMSPRIAMQLVGGGLLEAIPQADIVAWEDPEDSDGDGVSGRAARLPNERLGRFGWKATQPSVRAQTAAAFLGDLGITSDVLPDENCPPIQVECAARPSGGSPEISSVRLDVTAAYIRLLGVPTRRGGDTEAVLRGKTVFVQIGCGSCHRASYSTAESTEPELSGQKIWPYTDLLLHDMGAALADGSAEGAASAQEWRTPPLWGLGLVEQVNGTRYLLHDGRAESLAEAILWHGGEADHVVSEYVELSSDDRALLHTFIESL